MGKHSAGPRDWEPSQAPVLSATPLPTADSQIQYVYLQPVNGNADDAQPVRQIYFDDIIGDIFLILWWIIKATVWLALILPYRILRYFYRKLIR